MVADAEAQALRARDLGPRADDVALGAQAHRVPGVVLGVVGVEVVVMVGERDEVFGARLRIQVLTIVLVRLG